MVHLTPPLLRRLVLLPLALVCLGACSSAVTGPGGRISKVKYYHLQPGRPVQTIDTAVAFEWDHHMHGAATRAEALQRAGHYYSVLWKADDRSSPVQVVFEYRQARSGLGVSRQEQTVTDLHRSNVTHFQVTGDEYLRQGRVTGWRVRLMRDGQELVSQKSYLWD